MSPTNSERATGREIACSGHSGTAALRQRAILVPTMLPIAVVESNKASWFDVLHFIDEFPDNEAWRAWKAFMRPVMQSGIDAGLNQYFRAGTSMSHIIFSTSERHRLEQFSPAPPRITLGRRENAGMFVAWSHNNLWFHTPEVEDPVTSDSVMSVLRRYLADLWRETRPTELLPFDV